MDPYQTAPRSGFTQFVKEASNISADNKSIQFFMICALRVDKCELSVYMVRIFMKCMHVCAAQTTYKY